MAILLTLLSASFFAWALPFVQAWRIENPWLYFLLPLLVLPIIWDRSNSRDQLSTREEVAATRVDEGGSHRQTSWWAGPLLIVLTLLAHLFGASVGREAVGIQLGGWASRLRTSRAWNIRACLAVGFAIVLGTPWAAAVFVFESKRWRITWIDLAGIPLIAWLAYRFSLVIGVGHGEYRSISFVFSEIQSVGLVPMVLFVVVFVTGASVLSALFLLLVELASRRGSGFVKNYALPLVFLCAVSAVFVWLGPQAEATGLPGLGIATLPSLSAGETGQYTSLNHPLVLGILKVILTAAFVGFGVRGGELTPLLVAGAMTAVGLGVLFQLPTSMLVPIGFPVLWGIAARRPVAAAVLAIEIFGFAPWGLLGIAVFALVAAGSKIGDFVFTLNSRWGKAWRRGLYD